MVIAVFGIVQPIGTDIAVNKTRMIIGVVFVFILFCQCQIFCLDLNACDEGFGDAP